MAVRHTVPVVIAMLVFLAFGQTPISASEEHTIGRYDRPNGGGPLTEADADVSRDRVSIRGPPGTTGLRVLNEWLEAKLGDWSVDQRFTVDGADIVLDGRQANFSVLQDFEGEVFTRGSWSSIRLLDRPMWVAVAQEGPATYRISLEDGDTTGQPIVLARDWLWERGIHRPNLTHEDGYYLSAEPNEAGTGFTVDVPHFTELVLNPENLTVKGRQAGIVSDHPGEQRWDPPNYSLEVDVGPKLSSYELLVERDWAFLNIPNTVVSTHSWQMDEVDGVDYFSVLLSAAETPTVVELNQAEWLPYNVTFNVTDLKNRVEAGENVTLPVKPGTNISVRLDQRVEEINVTLDDGNTTYNASNVTFLTNNKTVSPNMNVRVTLSEHSITAVTCLPNYLNMFHGASEGLPSNGVTTIVMTTYWRYYPACPDPEADPYPYDPPDPPTDRYFHPRTYMDLSMVDNFGVGALFHVSDAVHEQHAMWGMYTGNWLASVEVLAIDEDWGQLNTCDDVLNAFTEWIDDEELRQSNLNEVHALVVGNDNLGTCIGRANGAATGGHLASPADSIAVGLDKSFGYRGKSSTTHLAQVMAQEIGHNIGEPAHRCLTAQGGSQTSIMCNDQQYDMKRFWLHYGDFHQSAERIIRGSAEWD